MATHTLDWNEPFPEYCLRGAAAFGNFDGVHRGHLSLLAELQKQARSVGGPAVAVTFDPHPLQLLRPEQFEPVLTTIADRADLLQANGADHAVILKTTWDLLHLTAAEFFDEVIRSRLQARAVVEGPNFGFGRDREGNVDMLARLCIPARIDFTVVSPLEAGGRPISSSRVRNALVGGDVRGAAALLGRPYLLRGIVGAGQRRGRQIGFPTANLERFETLVPGDGVYAVRVHTRSSSAPGSPGGERGIWPGAANIGPNPTFGEHARKTEVHIIGFQGDLLGQTLAVEFMERLRDTRPFAGIEQLVEQLRRDVEQAKAIVEGAALRDRVVNFLAEELAPALAMDGTAIEVTDVTDGVVRVRLGGACGCNPSSVMAIIMGIEENLRRKVPGVDHLEVIP